MNKLFPYVSIVIPIIGYKNISSYLVDSLRTLKYQKNRLEVLFVRVVSQNIQLPSLGIKVKFVNSQGTIGYSQAANVGIREGMGEYIFLINPDVLLDRNVLQEMINFFFHNSKVAIVGPIVFKFTNPEKISPYDLPGIKFNRWFGKIVPMAEDQILNLKTPHNVDWLSGCALLFSRKVWFTLGGFEEKLFIYWEDADFCMRAKEKGLKVVLVPQARVWHKGSAYMSSQNFSKIYYIVRNGSYFLHRHSGFLGKIFLHLRNLLMIGVKTIRFVFQPNKRRESYSVLSGIIDFYRGKWGRVVWE